MLIDVCSHIDDGGRQLRNTVPFRMLPLNSIIFQRFLLLTKILLENFNGINTWIKGKSVQLNLNIFIPFIKISVISIFKFWGLTFGFCEII